MIHHQINHVRLSNSLSLINKINITLVSIKNLKLQLNNKINKKLKIKIKVLILIKIQLKIMNYRLLNLNSK